MGSAAPTDSTRRLAQPAADLAVSKTQSPTRSNWLDYNNGESLQVNRCSIWKLAPDKSFVGSDRVWDEACKASGTHPVKVDSSASVEVHPLLTQVCPQAWPPPPKSYVTGKSAAFSGVPLAAPNGQQQPLPPSLAAQRHRSAMRSIVNKLRSFVGKSAIIVFCVLTCLMLTIGCALLTIGAMAVVDDKTLSTLIHVGCLGRLLPVNTIYLLKSVAVLLMVSGGVIVSLGFLGCCGFLLRSKVMVGTFGCLMTVIVVGQLSTTIVAFLNRDTMQCRLKRELLTALKGNYEGKLNSSNPISQAVDFLQLTLGCCGVDGPRDFFSTPWFKRTKYTNVTVPWTCCQVDNPGDWPVTTVNEHCPFAKSGPENPNTATPCFELAVQKVRQHYFEVVLFMTTVTALEVGAMGSAFIVANMLGKWAVRNKLRA